MRRILFVSNGHGEDVIAGQILDALRPGLPEDVSIDAWAMVGEGTAYQPLGLASQGPAQTLPSEGFGTLSPGMFWRDLRAGWAGSYLRQATHARGLRGRYVLMIGVGDSVPLGVAALARAPMAFVACAKSSWYGGWDAGKGGHNALERALMRRVCTDVFPRDGLTAEGLAREGVPARDFGNPMMDGLDVPPGPALLAQGQTGVAVFPGSRQDATQNCLFLLQAAFALDAGKPANPPVFLFAVTSASDLGAIRKKAQGWGTEDHRDGLALAAPNGTRALVLRGQFARILAESTVAVGLAGTANEQAVGMGLPLITSHGSGNQGEAFLQMKMRYFGPSAQAVDRDPATLAKAVSALLADPERRALMAEEGRKRMGPPGASARIAAQILARLEETA